MWFYFDPDGKVNTNGEGKSVVLFLYSDGRITSWGTVLPNTLVGDGPSVYLPHLAADPPWFGWD